MLQPVWRLDPVADGHSGEHDRQVSFDRLPHVVIDRPGLQVVFGHAEALLDVPQLVVGICLALGASFNIPILAAVGSVVFDNLPILFAVGIAVGLTGEGTVAFSTMPDATWHPEARDCRTSSPSTTPTCTPAPGTFDGESLPTSTVLSAGLEAPPLCSARKRVRPPRRYPRSITVSRISPRSCSTRLTALMLQVLPAPARQEACPLCSTPC